MSSARNADGSAVSSTTVALPVGSTEAAEPNRASIVDDDIVRRCTRPPTYPMQLMLAVFDFPQWSTGDDADLVRELVVAHIQGE